MTNTVPTLQEVEELFINNRKFEKIRNHLSQFNPIKTMGMERMEIRHSAILGWLLDPQETHGLGDSFLRAFLSEALKGTDSETSPSALEVSQSDLVDAEIRREWRNIDLLVISRNNGWVFVIENKFDSRQHSNQLTRYMDLVAELLLDKELLTDARGILITLSEDDPDDSRFITFTYEDICVLVESSIVKGDRPLKPEVETFVKHYLDVIMEATGMSKQMKEMEQVARQLYRDHKKVLDFVIEKGKTTDFSLACRDIFGDNPNYPDEMIVSGQNIIFNGSDSRSVSFLPKSWFDAFGGDEHWWHGCEYYWAGFPLITWIRLHPKADGVGGQVRFYAEVGPLSDHTFRKELIERIDSLKENNPDLRIGFQQRATSEGKRYSRFFKKNGFPVDDIHDQEKIAEAIKKAIRSYQKEINAVAKVLPEFIRHGQSEASK